MIQIQEPLRETAHSVQQGMFEHSQAKKANISLVERLLKQLKVETQFAIFAQKEAGPRAEI